MKRIRIKSVHFRDLEELHKAIYRCKKCKKPGRTVERVQPKWDPKKGRKRKHKWAIWIGQAPGVGEWKASVKSEKERREGRHTEKNDSSPAGIAFKGQAGRVFRSWLREHGFTDEILKTQFEKTSVTKCYPGRIREGVDRKPDDDEVEKCSNFLCEQIRLLKPKVLILMGEVALKAFFPDLKLIEAVGEELIWKGHAVICFPHAANANRWVLTAPGNNKRLDNAKELLKRMWLNTGGGYGSSFDN